MLADIASIPGAGGLAAAGILYAGLSLFVTGPLVGERMIERGGWTAHCERNRLAPTAQRPAQETVAGECEVWLRILLGPEGAAFCRRNSADINAMGDIAKRYARVNRAADAPSACACAAGAVLDNRRYDFALHAGSLRLITPRPVKDLAGELNGALASSVCRRSAS